MTDKIHPSAVVSDNADIGKNVEIGAFCVIGDGVKIEDNVKLHSHVVVDGNTHIGEGTVIFPFSSIGTIPQDLKFEGEDSKLIIGKNNIIREHVTMNPGTKGGGLLTQVGDNCLFMVGVHVAHDCIIGNNVIMANNATLAGHVVVGDFAVIGGLSAVHQFVRVGSHSMIGGMSGIENDVIPYGQAMGERASLSGLNLVGLKRRGFEKNDINTLRSAYRLIFAQEGTLSERVEDAKSRFEENKGVLEIIEFISSQSSRSICQPKNGTKNNANAA